MKCNRLMLSATGSGSGKTLITCGILQALLLRGKQVASFKCGPDYIDPMFHKKVLGTPSKNLDPYFTQEEVTRYLFARTAKEVEVSVIEGVMGYYDGLGGISSQASSYDLARITDTPVFLIVNCKGMSLSIVALIKGFLEFENPSLIQGVILNRISKPMYGLLKAEIEKRCNTKVYGYVPDIKEYAIESRHLGLVCPDEVANFQEKLIALAHVLEETLNLDEMLKVAEEVSEISLKIPVHISKLEATRESVLLAVARDDAFCFYYEDNLQLLQDLGAKLLFFSPLYDEALPKGTQGLLIGGGYPELYAKQLSENKVMLASIKDAIQKGLPTLAECGGFMYLHQQMEDMNGQSYPLVGTIKGTSYKTQKLGRFGYIELTAQKDQMCAQVGEKIKGHEFHYFDSTNNGKDFRANKPVGKRSWDCIHGTDTFCVGYPHLYYYSNVDMIQRFLGKCGKEGQRSDT